MNRKADITERFLERLVAEKLIRDEEKDLYRYGIYVLKGQIWSFLLAILAGILFHSFASSLIFMVCMMVLRWNAGGYHAESSGSCAVLSAVVIIAASAISGMRMPAELQTGIALVTLITCLYALHRGAVASRNKSITEEAQKKFNRNARILIPACYIVGVLLSLWGVKQGMAFLLAVLVTGGGLMVHENSHQLSAMDK